MIYKIDNCRVEFEFSASICGEYFLIIYGKHINGGFCCIPNHGIGCEMSEPDDVFYNSERLVLAGFSWAKAQAVAEKIKETAERIRVLTA